MCRWLGGRRILPQGIFGIDMALGYLASALCIAIYVWPRLRTMDGTSAHRAVAKFNSFRFVGSAFFRGFKRDNSDKLSLDELDSSIPRSVSFNTVTFVEHGVNPGEPPSTNSTKAATFYEMFARLSDIYDGCTYCAAAPGTADIKDVYIGHD